MKLEKPAHVFQLTIPALLTFVNCAGIKIPVLKIKQNSMKIVFTWAIVALGVLLSCAQKPNQEKSGVNHMSSATFTGKTDTATFGTGCFWCTEAIFKELEGVIS